MNSQPQLSGKGAALHILHRTLASIDLRAALSRCMARSGDRIFCASSCVNLESFREIFAVAIGKAASPMAEALALILPSGFRLKGILVAPNAPSVMPPGWEVHIGGHPIPTQGSFDAGRAILSRLAGADESTLVIFLLSGGGSALVECPLNETMTLSDFQQLNHLLVTCGAPIEEINAVRKHLSAVKGGRLAAAAPAATKLTYGVSDVPAGHESALASGPTLPDPTTCKDAREVIRIYSLAEKLPPSVRRFLESLDFPETPKLGASAFAHSHFEIVLGQHDLTHAAHRAAEGAGYRTVCDNTTDGWPIERAADQLLAHLARIRSANTGAKVCVIADGEVSSPIAGDGVGGRNSAFVLACVERIAGSRTTVLSAGTDGIDGNSLAAGALADGATLGFAHQAGLSPRDFIARSDAYSFFRRLGDAIETGPTGNNLRDLRVLLMD